MLTCDFCTKTLDILRGYVLRCKIHRNKHFVIMLLLKIISIEFTTHLYPLLLLGPFLQILSVPFRCVSANSTQSKSLFPTLKKHIAEG